MCRYFSENGRYCEGNVFLQVVVFYVGKYDIYHETGGVYCSDCVGYCLLGCETMQFNKYVFTLWTNLLPLLTWNCIIRTHIVCALHQMGQWRCQGVWNIVHEVHVGKLKRCMNFQLESENEHLGDRKIILKWIFEKCGVRVWTGFFWPRMGNKCLGCMSGRNILCNSHQFYRSNTSGIIHSLDYLHYCM